MWAVGVVKGMIKVKTAVAFELLATLPEGQRWARNLQLGVMMTKIPMKRRVETLSKMMGALRDRRSGRQSLHSLQ